MLVGFCTADQTRPEPRSNPSPDPNLCPIGLDSAKRCPNYRIRTGLLTGIYVAIPRVTRTVEDVQMGKMFAAMQMADRDG